MTAVGKSIPRRGRRDQPQPNSHRLRLPRLHPCALDNVCVFQNADDVFATYQRLRAADVVVFAATVQDRYLSSRWKMFLDRSFFYNHVPIFSGKQIVYVVAGPLGQLAPLRQILAGYAEMQQANLVGMVSDECGDSAELDRLLDGLASQAIDFAAAGYIQPMSFLAVAGRKLFRDELWSHLQFVFCADNRYYRSRGLYDFPAAVSARGSCICCSPSCSAFPASAACSRRRSRTRWSSRWRRRGKGVSEERMKAEG